MSGVAGGKNARDMVALAREYPGTDAWSVAAAAAGALLGQGYVALRRKGLTAASAAARVDADLRSGGSDIGGSGSSSGDFNGNDSGSGSEGLLDTLLGTGRGGQGVVDVARGVFVRVADGKDLHHLDLLLRLMSEASAKREQDGTGGAGCSSGVTVGGGSSGGSGSSSTGKNVIERRLHAHCGLVRRLLKAAPPGLDYKRLVGEDPLGDPLADPQGAKVGEVGAAPSSNGATKRNAAGLAMARARAMSELRSIAGLEHTPALSKLALRIPGLSGSAVYLAAAQRVLCGETGGLSPEALALLHGRQGGGGDGNRGGHDGEEAEAASSSVYHLLSPLLQKMVPEDLVGIAEAACAPTAAGDDGLGYYSCRRASPTEAVVAASASLPSTKPPFPDRMEPLRLTVRCRRRVLAATSAVLTRPTGSGGRGGDAAAATPSTALAAERLARLKALLAALHAVSTPPSARGGAFAPALEAAWAVAARASAGAAAEASNRAIGAAVTAAAGMVSVGFPPVAVEAVCSSMRMALGVQDGAPASTIAGSEDSREGAAVAAGHGPTPRLDIPRVYSSATSDILARLVSGNPEDRKRALDELLTVCAAAGPVHGQPESASADDVDEVGAAAARAWQVLAPALDLFCREGDVGRHSREGETGTTAPAASLVLWARAEVLTLLRSFGGGDSDGFSGGGGLRDDGNNRDNEASRGVAEYCSGGGEDIAFGDGAVDTREGDSGEGIFAKVVGDNGGSVGGGVTGGGNDSGGSEGRQSPTSQLSVSFLRVAELVMVAFDMRVKSGDVDSWASRSSFLETLTVALRSGGTHDRPGEGESENTGGRRNSVDGYCQPRYGLQTLFMENYGRTLLCILSSRPYL